MISRCNSASLISSALAALARYPDGVRQGDLAELMNVSAPSTTRLVEVMSEHQIDFHQAGAARFGFRPAGQVGLPALGRRLVGRANGIDQGNEPAVTPLTDFDQFFRVLLADDRCEKSDLGVVHALGDAGAVAVDEARQK